ncbi:hypothetical protein JSCD13_36190 [Clostridioides difficile]|nr:hypothetical protein JSCD13_36190 [Clostridioides difficile]
MFRCDFFFFFQAEAGIRVRRMSRGLGDVNKRQVFPYAPNAVIIGFITAYAAGL